jgi:excisionase family DNA binding protein
MTITLTSERLLYSRAEACQLLGVHINTLARLIDRGELAPRRVGDRVMFTRQELERFAGVRS